MMQRVKRSVTLFENNPKGPINNNNSAAKNQNNKNLWLPDNLSGRILDLEFECETENLSKKIIDDLVDLYSGQKAVEFYNERGNAKYKIYQKRMQMFLSNPRIEEILKGRSAKIIMAQQKNEVTLKQAESSNKKQVQQIIKEHEKVSLGAMKKMREELKKQEQNLEQRIRKKRTNSNRSTRTAEQQIDDEFGRGQKGEKMNIKLLLDGINGRHPKVFF